MWHGRAPSFRVGVPRRGIEEEEEGGGRYVVIWPLLPRYRPYATQQRTQTK